ncbi:MAG: trehalose 2-sulfotransferase [Thermoleophilaceae bacterium]|jgi:LPS sulfotransferase NodH|nr:trehalose 2-sulfotransferase [Thermoleophilaceae bacterium]
MGFTESTLPPAGPASPTASYLICATPRSGSTLLCEALSSTEIAGRPDEYFEALRHSGVPRKPTEYFDDADTVEFDAQLGDGSGTMEGRTGTPSPWNASTAWNYLEWVFNRATTPNGMFAAKLMWGYLPDFLSFLRELRGTRSLETPELLDKVFPSPRFVWVTRQDKVRQAVSLWKALQTETWRADPQHESGSRPDLAFSFEGIAHLRRQLAEQDAAWCRWFFENGIRPQTVVYEQLAADYRGTLAATLDFIGAPISREDIPDPPLERQADSLSEEWVQRYTELEQTTELPARVGRADVPPFDTGEFAIGA